MSNLTASDFQKMFEKPVSAQQRYEMERPVPEARAIPSYSERRKNSAFDYVPTRGELRGSIFDLAHDLGLSPRASRKTSEFLIGTPSGTDDSAMPIPDIGALDFVTGTAAKRFVDPLMMADAQQFRLDDDPTMSTLMAGLAVFPPAAYAVKGGQAFGKEVNRLTENALTTNPGATSVEAVQSRYVHALSGAKTPPGGVCHDAACKMADSINPGDQIRTFTVDGRQPSHSILTDAKGNVKADSFKGKGQFNPETGGYFDSRFGEEHRPMAVTDAFAAKKAGERLAQPKVSAADFDPSRRGFMQGAGLAAVATQLPAPLIKAAGELGAGMREAAGIPGAAKVAGTAAKVAGTAAKATASSAKILAALTGAAKNMDYGTGGVKGLFDEGDEIKEVFNKVDSRVNEILGGGEGKITNISIPHGEKGWGDYSYDELVEELGEHYSAEDISSIGDEIIKISEMKPTNIEKFGSQVVKEIDYDGNKLVVWEDYDTFPIDRNIFFRADAPEQISGGRRDFMGQVPGAALAGAGLAGAGIAALGVPAAVKLAGKIGGGITGIPEAAKVAGTAAKAVGKAVTSGALSKIGAMIPVIFKHADNVRLKDEVERLKNFDVLNNQYVHSTGETNRKIGGLIKEKLNPSEGEMIIKMDPGNPNIINSVVEARVKKESDGADTIFDGYVDSDEYISEYGEDAASDYIRDAWDDVDIRDEYISETDSVEIELDKMARELDKMEPSNVHDIEYKTPGKESRTERVSVKEYTTPEGDFVKIYDDIYFKVKKAGERLAQPKVSAPEQISKGRRDFMGQVPGAALAGAGIAALGVPAAVKLAGKIGGGITGIPGAAKVAGTAAKAVASKIVVSPAMMALAKGANRYIDSDDVPDDFMSGISDTRDLSFSLGHDFPDSKLGRDIDMGGNDFSSGFVEMEKFLDEKLGDAADFSESIYSVNTKYLDDALYYSEDGNTNEYIGMLKSALKREPISTNEFDGIILKEIDIDGDIAILAEDVEKSKWPRLLFKLKETNLK